MAKKPIQDEEVETTLLDNSARMGRPTKFKHEFVEQGRKLANLGATDMEIAEFFGVSDRTIYSWKGQFPDFLQALNEGKEALDGRVEKSLYHRAVGYTHDSVQVNVTKDGDVFETPVIKHYPPDTAACIFWLRNRRGKDWKNSEGGGGELKDLMEFTLKIGKAAGAIEERKRLADSSIDGRKQLRAVASADPED